MSRCVYTSQCPDCLRLGNKCDLEEQRQVQFEEACDLAKERGILAALETSAKVTSVRAHAVQCTECGSCSTLLSNLLCLGESERGRGLRDDGQRAALSQRPQCPAGGHDEYTSFSAPGRLPAG